MIGHLLQAIRTQAWAIRPEYVRPLIDSILLGGDERFGALAEAAKKLTSSQDNALRNRGTVGLIPVHGPMFHRLDAWVEKWFGVTSTERVIRNVNAAAADGALSSIMLHVDSPGGSIRGIDELAAAIRAAKEVKPVIVMADPMAASAAYWFGSQATEFVVSPQGDVGSIGVLTIHADFSKQLEAEGVDVTLIGAGKFKLEGSPFEPLSDDAREWLQSRVDEAYSDFVDAVATGRGVDRKAVINGFGQGRVVEAREALRLGMVDRIATFNDTVARFVGKRGADGKDRERRATIARVRAASS